jgi:hypothetical protein
LVVSLIASSRSRFVCAHQFDESKQERTSVHPEDKLRLMLCYYFSMLASGSEKGLSRDDLAEYERKTSQHGSDVPPPAIRKERPQKKRTSLQTPKALGSAGDDHRWR